LIQPFGEALITHHYITWGSVISYSYA
jgi:hypothetical protein